MNQNKLLICAWAVMWVAVSVAVVKGMYIIGNGWPLLAFFFPSVIRLHLKVGE